jgi:hypothetical protein
MTKEWRRVLMWISWIAGLLMLFTGIWALAAPSSFVRDVGPFLPYNRHFVHDTGAFQAGIGAALLAGGAGWDGLTVGLIGFAVSSVLHELSHVMDRHIGGHSTDPVGLGVVAVLSVVAVVLAVRSRPAPTRPAAPTGGRATAGGGGPTLTEAGV